MSKKTKTTFVEFPNGDMVRRDHILRVLRAAGPGNNDYRIHLVLGGELSMQSPVTYTFISKDERDAALDKIKTQLKFD